MDHLEIDKISQGDDILKGVRIIEKEKAVDGYSQAEAQLDKDLRRERLKSFYLTKAERVDWEESVMPLAW